MKDLAVSREQRRALKQERRAEKRGFMFVPIFSMTNPSTVLRGGQLVYISREFKHLARIRVVAGIDKEDWCSNREGVKPLGTSCWREWHASIFAVARYNPSLMNNAGAFVLAVLMFGTTVLLRRSGNDMLRGMSATTMIAMWFVLTWVVRLKRGQAGIEQWRSIRQRGRMYFALVYGGWWVLFFALLKPSCDFAEGSQIEFKHFWWHFAIGVCAGPLGHLWEWHRRERNFYEAQGAAPLEFNGVP